MKVQALTDGYYDENRIRKGDVFELKVRKGITIDRKTGKKVPYEFSVESQFSESWMRKVEPGNGPIQFEEEELNLPGVKIRKPGKKKTLSESQDDVI